jgi:hypothetical protein
MKEFPGQWMESPIGPIYKKDDEKECSDRGSISLLSTIQNVIPLSFVKLNSMCRGNYCGSLMWLLIKEVK